MSPVDSDNNRHLLWALHEDSYDTIIQNHAMCNAFYNDWLIPRYDRDAEYLLILSSIELLIVLILLIILFMKKYYMKQKKFKKAKAILLPFYDRIVWWYTFITIIRMLFAIAQYIYNVEKIEHLWYIAMAEALSDLGIISLELFISLLISQTSVGKNAFKRATKITFLLCLILGIFYFCRSTWGSNIKKYRIWIIFSILIHGFLLGIYTVIFCYVYVYHENLMKMKRKRNKILYIYLLGIGIIHSIFTISYILEANVCFISENVC